MRRVGEDSTSFSLASLEKIATNLGLAIFGGLNVLGVTQYIFKGISRENKRIGCWSRRKKDSVLQWPFPLNWNPRLKPRVVPMLIKLLFVPTTYLWFLLLDGNWIAGKQVGLSEDDLGLWLLRHYECGLLIILELLLLGKGLVMEIACTRPSKYLRELSVYKLLFEWVELRLGEIP